jgi:hypothetical protein
MAAASSARRTTTRVGSKKTTPHAAAASQNGSRGAQKQNSTGSLKGSRKEISDDATSPHRAAGSRNASRSVPPKSAPTKKSKPGALVQRVYNTIDGELEKLEKQKGLTSQDRERASRALSQMVNALEKAVEMQREMTKRKATGGDAKSKEALAHAEDLRREIAERLERLNRKRTTRRSSE